MQEHDGDAVGRAGLLVVHDVAPVERKPASVERFDWWKELLASHILGIGTAAAAVLDREGLPEGHDQQLDTL